MSTTNHAEDQARAQLESIRAMVAALGVDYDRLDELREAKADAEDSGAAMSAEDLDELTELEAAAGGCTSRDDAEQRIQEDPLSIEFRSGWTSDPTDLLAEEFRIVLCTGGPHVELQGELSGVGVSRVRMLYQDWGTPLTELVVCGAPYEALEAYCESVGVSAMVGS